jgi:hypothetical protein
MLIRKSKLCWLFQKDAIKLNTDVRERFIEKKSFELEKINSSHQIVWKAHSVSHGSWIVVVHDCKFYVGFVINFQKKLEKSKAQRLFRYDADNFNEKARSTSQNCARKIRKCS